jgi:HK97 family phage major capsid protein
MPFNNLISRTDAQALVPEQVSYDLLQMLPSESAAMTLFRHLQMSTNVTRMPVISALPAAYFVNGDTGLKQTTEVDWTNKFLNVEEIAAIVPIPEAVLDDQSYDVWGSIKPLIANAIGRTLDAAVFFAANKPASWPNAIVTDAVTAGQTVTRGTNAAAAGGIVGDFSDLFATVEASGYDVNGLIAATTYKGILRQARATTGESLLGFGEVSQNSVFGVDAHYPMRGLWPTPGAGSAEAIVGDFTQGILGLRQDITYKVLDQAVIQAADGSIQFNLAQQDMVALRVVFRSAFQVANTINYDKPTDPTAAIGSGSRYPWAVLRHA